ncbi:MAG: hypothetical protein JEY79_05855 [Pseudodesulfovibrio sp.]|nr:hypothetical protein [Pseudodesulfovibrio sp.]
MEERCTTSANGEVKKSPMPNGKYHFTPKVVVIAGPPAAGKSYAAKRLVNEFGYKLISLDAINSAVADQYDGNIDSVRNPETFTAFRLEFVEILRHCRYQNLVLEGCRISYPHIYRAFLDSVNHRYSPFTIMQPFYLNPPRETRMEQYLLRKIKWTKDNLKGTDTVASQSQLDKPFQEHLNPVLPGFIETPDNESILQWAEANENSIHPRSRTRRP